MVAVNALNVMKEGHDGSGVGLFLTDLGGEFEKFKNEPILSGIFSNEGIKALDRFMIDPGFHGEVQTVIPAARNAACGNAQTGQLRDPGL